MATRYQNMTPDQKAKAHARSKRWKDKNRDKVRRYKSRHYFNNRDKYMTLERDRQYRVRYGITLQDYDRILSEQGGKCAICKSDKAGNKGQCFAVDHCHDTGKVRGLLCAGCNIRIEWLRWFDKHKAAIDLYLGTTTQSGMAAS